MNVDGVFTVELGASRQSAAYRDEKGVLIFELGPGEWAGKTVCAVPHHVDGSRVDLTEENQSWTELALQRTAAWLKKRYSDVQIVASQEQLHQQQEDARR